MAGRRAVERRVVSVLFADLVGFTSLSEELDAEDVTLVQDAYFDAVRETVARHGGQLEKFVGDAAMAVFGAPRVRDDDAERAVRAGLALVAAVQRVGAALGLAPGALRARALISVDDEPERGLAELDPGRRARGGARACRGHGLDGLRTHVRTGTCRGSRSPRRRSCARGSSSSALSGSTPPRRLRTVAWDVLSDEQRELRDLVRQLARERIAPRAAEIDASHEFPWDVVELFRENDIFGLFFEEEYGGLGTGTLLSLIAIEEVGKVCATSALILAVQELGSLGLKLAGNDDQKERYLPKFASGEWLPAYALTESGSGSDSAAMRTTARREGDEYVLDGSKRFITNAGVASLYTVFAKTDPDAGHPGISAFVVESDAPGFAVARLEPKMGISGSTTGELTFDGCRIPAANLLGEEGEGFRIAMRILDRSRPGVAAQALGIAQGATDYALDYAKTRETMGKPIGQHQLIQAKLADMETECEAARGLLYRFGRMADEGVEGPELTKASAMAKLKCGDVAMAVTTEAVQILGGYGYIMEYPVERFMRDAKITQIYEGTQEIQRLVIAREMLRESRAFLLAGVG
jgi:alkylation response protein AidB-like acyl-CoA dehydrogenase